MGKIKGVVKRFLNLGKILRKALLIYLVLSPHSKAHYATLMIVGYLVGRLEKINC
jgi:hypothetical protein